MLARTARGRHAARTSTPRSGCRSPCSGARRAPRCSCSRWRCAAPGQIAELAAIAEPDVGVIVNVGPVHLELLGTIEAIAAAKAELIAGLRPGGTAVVPAGEPLLDAHLRDDVDDVTFGQGGDVDGAPGRPASSPFTQRPPAPQRAGRAGRAPRARRGRADGPSTSRCRAAAASGSSSPGRGGRRRRLLQRQPDVDARRPRRPRRVRARPARRGARRHARARARRGRASTRRSAPTRASAASTCSSRSGRWPRMADGYGERARAARRAAAAAALVRGLLQPGDTVLVKASRGVGLEVVAEALEGA